MSLILKMSAKRNPFPVKTKYKKDGFTLLEVLVALLVLSIGLIGLAGLQLFGVTNSRDAYFRTQAVILSYDIADRMRANIAGTEAGDYDKATGAATSSCRTTTGCSPSQLAADDVRQWLDAVARLPGGQATICIDSNVNNETNIAATGDCDGNGTRYAAKIWWDQDRSGAVSADERFVLEFWP